MNQLLENFEFDPERGALDLQGVRYLLMRPDTLVEMQKLLESHLPEETAGLLRQAGAEDGARMAIRFRDAFSYGDEEVLSSSTFLLAQSGWGALSVEMAHFQGREIVVKARDSATAEIYGPSVYPVCHLLLGLLEGVAMTLFDSEVDGQEVQCEAKGDSCCRFVISGRSV